MTTLADREQSIENKYAHDEQFKFKVTSRRNNLTGLWAAELLGKPDADAYAKEVVMADFDAPGDDDLIQKLLADFSAAGITQDATSIRRALEQYQEEATKQLMETAA
jgi:hypothetical protein